MTQSNPSRDVAVIGLGKMGAALAETLLVRGFRVTVWNRTAAKSAPLAKADATVAASVCEAAAAVQTIVVCVVNHEASRALLLTDAVAASLSGKTLVQLSTITADESRELGHWAAENHIAYLDGSILGYPQNVLDHDCTIIYSGPQSVFDANQGVLSAMGGKPKLIGEAIGGAPTFDKSIYANHYGSLLAFFHGAAICHAAGIPLESYVENIVEGGAGMKPRFGEMLVARSFDSQGGSIELAVAAYAHVTRLSDKLGIDPAFPNVVADYMDRAVARGHGDQEFAAIFEIMIEKGV